MNRLQYAKLFGMIAAMLTGAATIIQGDLITGVGIIAASFSSATGLFGSK